jgi:hypothetical protein
LRYPLSEVIHMPGTLVRLSQQMLVMLWNIVEGVIDNETSSHQITPSVCVVSGIHGQYYDLLRSAEKCGWKIFSSEITLIEALNPLKQSSFFSHTKFFFPNTYFYCVVLTNALIWINSTDLKGNVFRDIFRGCGQF